MLKDHLEQLVRAGYLKEFVVDLRNQEARQGTRPQKNPFPPPLGVMKVIRTTSTGTLATRRRGVLAVVSMESCPNEQPSEKKLKHIREPIAFNDNDLEGTIQSYDGALVITAWINGL